MKEEFLVFVWKQQYFKKQDLKSEQGQKIQVIDPGQLNTDSGPDFNHACIRIDTTKWAGPVEIHVKASDWFLHNHHQDPAYDQVILHIVWSNDKAAITSNGREIPVLVLKNRVEMAMVLIHQKLKGSFRRIPCEHFTATLALKTIDKMMKYALKQRLARKSNYVLNLLQKNQGDWDQVTYLMFGQNFGFRINSNSFSMLVRSVPLTIARKIRSGQFQLEALYFGQAGLLELVTGDSYYLRLQAEYLYLRNKYSLTRTILKRSMWKYLRLRPQNFPGLRIAQFASFIHNKGYRFSEVRELHEPKDYLLNELTPSIYWRRHYDFGKQGGSGGGFGISSCHNLIVNTVVPLLLAYASYTGQSQYGRQAIVLLKRLPAEHNGILSYWKDIGFKVSSAWESQALIELNNLYCQNKKCLHCEIGRSILTNSRQ